MEQQTDQITTSKRHFSPLLIVFVLAVILGALLTLFLVANQVGQKYRTSIRTELTTLRSATNVIDQKSGNNEKQDFTSIKPVLDEYVRDAPQFKSTLLGSQLSAKYRASSKLRDQYQQMLTGYQSLVNEYFTKVAPLTSKTSLTPSQKSYLQDYGKRLNAVKQQRRQLENQVK